MEVESKIKQHVASRNGFFVHGTTGRDLTKVMDEPNGKLEISRGHHDFGDGFYCFKNEFQWALTFAVHRCNPVGKGTCNDVAIKSCNPSVVVFPEHDHTIFNNPLKAVEVRGEPMGSKEAPELGSEWKLREKEKHDEFMMCQKNGKQTKNLDAGKILSSGR